MLSTSGKYTSTYISLTQVQYFLGRRNLHAENIHVLDLQGFAKTLYRHLTRQLIWLTFKRYCLNVSYSDLVVNNFETFKDYGLKNQ